MPRVLALLATAFAVLAAPAAALASPYSDAITSTPGLAGYWRLGERSGGTAADVTGLNHGTWSGGVQQGVTGALFGDGDLAASLDGSAQLQLGTFAPPGDFSVEAWVSTAPASHNRFVLTRGSMVLLMSSWNQPWFGAPGQPGIGGPTLAAGTWHHIVATQAGRTSTLYVDGQEVASRVARTTPRITPGPLVAGESLSGGLDELAVYTRALSPAEVAAHAAAGMDPSLPRTTIVSSPAGRTDDPSATFSFTTTAAAGATFACSLDGAPYTPCSSPVTYSPISQGTHTFSVETIDRWGRTDVSPPSFGWTMDPTAAPDYSPIPPTTTITPSVAAMTNSSDVTFTFTADRQRVTYSCSLDGGDWNPCPPTTTFTGLDEGAHELQVIATDRFGQVEQTPAEFDWIVDQTPPETWLVAVAPSPQSPMGVAAFGSEPGAVFQCQFGGGAWQPCRSPVPVGAGAFAVRAVDPAGNADPTPASVVLPAAQAGGPRVFTLQSSPGRPFQCSLDGADWAPCGGVVSTDGLTVGPHSLAVRAGFWPDGPTVTTPRISWTVPPPVYAVRVPDRLARIALSSRTPRSVVRFTLSSKRRVRVVILRLARHRRQVAAWTVRGRAGVNTVRIPRRHGMRLTRGRYMLVVHAGRVTASARFRVV